MKLILSFLCTLLIIAVEGQNTTITGNINGNAPAKIFFYEVLQQPVLIDSADVNTKGEFKIKTEIKTTGFYRIQSDVKNFMMLILKPGDNLTIQANGGKMNKNPQIKGSPESVLIYKYGTLIDAIAEALDSLSGIIKGSNYTGEQQVARQAAMQKHEELTLKQTEIVREMFSKHPGSLACMFFVNLLPPASHPDVYTKVDSALYSQYPDNIYVKDLHQKLTPLLFLSEGSVAPEITQPDT
ncbi:DUF4369 domain-containing protein, partial [Patescibacteria group bacterium]|nr:DUF4369 domain-containing protein [Patescibacteria group bacterium]